MHIIPRKRESKRKKKEKAAKMIAIAIWNAERFGASTEGQWVNGKYIGNDPAYKQCAKPQK